MANITVNGSALNSSLQSLLTTCDICPGDEPSYQACKTIYAYHPLGGKMVDAPIRIAMSQQRDIKIPNSIEERLRDAFSKEWRSIKADKYIENGKRISMIYGTSAVIFGAKDVPTDVLIDPKNYWKLDLYFNVLDPLNTAGSLVLNQDPNAPDFQKPTIVTAAGQKYHRSRSVVLMNDDPLYIEYTTSAFGYVGRSVYQRALYPLKTFVQSMITDDLVITKAGVIVAKMKAQGSTSDRLMSIFNAQKRNVVKEAQTGNVISITPEEAIESLNLQNTDTAMTTARNNVIHNIASATPMPAKLLTSESFAEGFGEGSEDAKDVIRFIDNLRASMQPLYDFFDNIVMRRAWNPEFYAAVQAENEEYEDVSYEEAFFNWKNAFEASWPSLLIEPESKKVEVEEVKFRTLVSAFQIYMPYLDPKNKVIMMQFLADNINESKHLFSNPLIFDYEALEEYIPEQQEMDEEMNFEGDRVSKPAQL